jgi:TetR/AcrR family transcriptional repressor of nem operon
VLSDERMCLCGMLAAEYSTLPAAMQSALRTFFELNEAWLADLLEAGQHDGTLSVSGRSADAARMLVGALEGEMLVARAYGDPARFIAAAELLVAPLDTARARVRSSPRAGTRAARGAARRLRSPRPARSARAGPRP